MSLPQRMTRQIGSFLTGQDGASMLEYCILLAFLVFVCFLAIVLVGQNTLQLFQIPGWN
jgi:hypothetical protein